MPAALAPQSAGTQPVTGVWQIMLDCTHTSPLAQNCARHGVFSSTRASWKAQSVAACGTAALAVATTTRERAHPPVPGWTARKAIVGFPFTRIIFAYRPISLWAACITVWMLQVEPPSGVLANLSAA